MYYIRCYVHLYVRIYTCVCKERATVDDGEYYSRAIIISK